MQDWPWNFFIADTNPVANKDIYFSYYVWNMPDALLPTPHYQMPLKYATDEEN
jgi:hypothetical protein